MLRNYVVVGLRTLAKNRTYAAINIVGLAIGMAACLLILLYVRYEFGFERWLPGSERSVQFQSVYRDPAGGPEQPTQMAPYVAAAALRKDFPELEAVAYALNSNSVLMKGDTPIPAQSVVVERDFFAIYPIPFLHGSGPAALRDPNSVALSASEARKLFGTDDAVGRTVVSVGGRDRRVLRVAGVFADLPRNTHQDFDVVRLFDPKSFTGDAAQLLTGWGELDGWVYARLRPGVDPYALEARLPAWAARNVPLQNFGGERRRQNEGFTYRFVRLPDVHLGRGQGGNARAGNDRGTMIAFAAVALLVLAMACVNFVNLTTARASQRAREVALRKVLGARRSQLIAQYLVEAVLVAAFATLLALAIAELALPWLSGFLHADLALRYLGREGVLLPVLALTLLVGVAGGAYPAFRLSAIRPARVLKANRSTEAEGSGRLRNALVVGQFAVSIALIICTGLIHAQTVHALAVDPGFRRDGLLQLDVPTGAPHQAAMRSFAEEVRHLPGVTGVTRTRIGVDTGTRSSSLVMLPGQTRSVILGQYSVEPGFFDVMGLHLLAGRTLSAANALDDATLPDGATDAQQRALVARGMNVVLSRAAAERLGFRDPAQAIGRRFGYEMVDEKNGAVPTTVVGVVEDARYHSVREAAQPTIYYRDDNHLSWMEVRFATGEPVALRERIAGLWKRFEPEVPFSAQFSDAIAERQYRGDRARAQVFAGFAGLSVVIGCLGLFGLAAFTAERRTKEIGIRKVLGARTRDIVRLLVWQFSRPVLAANLIAWPVAWWAMRRWLDGFDTRVALTPVPFAAAGLLALAIAVVTVAGHAVRVGRTNPVHALRYE